MDPLQLQRLHQRLLYLETAVAEFHEFIKFRFDAGFRERVPIEVQVAREADKAIHDEE